MHLRRHFLRDVFIFSFPVVTILGIGVIASAVTFYNAEIVNFHGYVTRSLRIGGWRQMLHSNANAFNPFKQKRYLPNKEFANVPLRRYSIQVKASNLDKLKEHLPGSAKVWQRAWLQNGNKFTRVEIRNRGQRLENFFWARKAWQFKTKKESLIDGQRIIKLAPLGSRLENYICLMLARELGLPAPKTDIVQLFINKEDQGLYVQEEEIDELMIRRVNRMPGDVFHGELFFPNEPKLNTDDLFVNPYYWEKKSRNNRYGENHRPYLTEFLDLVCDKSLESYERFYQLLDKDEIALYFAVVTFLGDQHADSAHNHKLYFNPLSGKFESIVWNLLLGSMQGKGVESFANRFFYKLTRDPRFLDRVHEILNDRILTGEIVTKILGELDRIQKNYSNIALDQDLFKRSIESAKRRLATRASTLARIAEKTEVSFLSQPNETGTALSIYATALTSFKLRKLKLNRYVDDLLVYEDRDFDGKISGADRQLPVSVNAGWIDVLAKDAYLYTGRDFSAPYRPDTENEEHYLESKYYTTLASLRSPYLLSFGRSDEEVLVEEIVLERTVYEGDVVVQRGHPETRVSTETIHPWRFNSSIRSRRYRFSGRVELTEDLEIFSRDSVTVEPGTEFFLGPDVSIISYRRLFWEKVKVTRLDPNRPWGVIALQGQDASGSVISDCVIEGGSHKTWRYIYYSGMVSVHYANNVTIRNSIFSDNVRGDDVIRFAKCHDLCIEGVSVLRANGDAIDCDISTGQISNVKIRDPMNDGIDLMTSNVDLANIDIINAGDKGISLGENSNPKIVDCKIVNSVIGIGIKDGSDPIISNVHFAGNQIAVTGYDKNWRYPGGGKGTLHSCTFVDNEVDIKLDKGSSLNLEACITQNRYVLPLDMPNEFLKETK